MIACGDLKSVIATMNGIPAAFSGTTTCVINAQDGALVAQSLLLLLCAMTLSPAIGAGIMMHLWYSARLTPPMLAIISERLRPLVAAGAESGKSTKDELVTKTFSFGSSQICVRLGKHQWASILRLFEFEHGVAQTEAERERATANVDQFERHLFNLPPSRRLSTQRMRATGVLLPFGTPLDEFTCPNPTLFDADTATWLPPDYLDPMNGWPLKDVIKPRGYNVPTEDIYGHLYFYIREQLETFCEKLSNTMVDFHFYSQDLPDLPRVLKETLHPFSTSSFDRIDASTIADTIGVEATLLALGPLLKSPEQNPHAVLLTQHLTATDEALAVVSASSPEIKNQEFEAVSKFFNPETLAYQITSSDGWSDQLVLKVYQQMVDAQEIVRNNDDFFDFWLNSMLDFDKVCVAAGMDMCEANTVVEAWPTRMKKQHGEEGAQEEFDLILQSTSKGKERVVEWIRASPGSAHWRGDPAGAEDEDERAVDVAFAPAQKPGALEREVDDSDLWPWETAAGAGQAA